MPQFFVLPEDIIADRFSIRQPGEVRHLVRVFRVKEGQTVRISDGTNRYLGQITGVSFKRVTGRIIKTIRPVERHIYVRMFVAPVKPSRFEILIEKLTEIGVEEIVPLMTDRVSVGFSAGNLLKRYARWKRIVLSAVKQCGCQGTTLLGMPVKFSEAVTTVGTGEKCLLAFEGQGCGTLGEIMERFRKEAGGAGPLRFNVFIGPEGGWTENEIGLASGKGVILFTLGENVLRTETAAIVSAGVILT